MKGDFILKFNPRGYTGEKIDEGRKKRR